MKSQIIYLVLGALIGTIIGFMAANYMNRLGSNSAAGTVAATAASVPDSRQNTLSPEEIKGQLEKADANPEDIAFQKALGIALYGYGAAKEDPALIGDAIRLLERAQKSDGKDRDVLVALGNSHFDIGYFTKDGGRFSKARDYYNLALEVKPGDPNVIVDVGLTYALVEPPDLPRAVEAYRLALNADPKHERTLQMITDASIRKGDVAAAREFLERLREVNAANPMIAEFTQKLSRTSR